MSETLVKVDNVSKRFCRDLKRSLWYGLKDIGSELLGGNEGHERLRKDEFWAVKDVSFELRRGECLGLIGHNGAGKSTLLKMLNGLVKPNKGSIITRGRIGALIELGAGFNPILSGRENIYINAAVLGFTRKEMDAKFDAIVEFAEMESFIDMPVQYYSSGMKVRLGFAVASQLEPDVLLIDEVLAVGDIGFQIKCFNRINELIDKCAVIFVSHSMPNVGRISTRVIFMSDGRVKMDSTNSQSAIEGYYSEFKSEETRVISEKLRFQAIEFVNQNASSLVKFGGDLVFRLRFQSDVVIEGATVGLAVIDQSLRCVAVRRQDIGQINVGSNSILFTLNNLMLSGSRYYFSIEINRFSDGVKKQVLGLFRNIASFAIVGHPFVVDSVVFLEGNFKVND